MASQASSSSSRSPSSKWRTFLQVISVVVAIEIGLHSFIVREPVVTLVLAAERVQGVLAQARHDGAAGGVELPLLVTDLPDDTACDVGNVDLCGAGEAGGDEDHARGDRTLGANPGELSERPCQAARCPNGNARPSPASNI